MIPVMDITLAIIDFLAKKRRKKRNKTKMAAVEMFDLPNSAAIKLSEGHTKGTRQAIQHNQMCQEIAEKHDGNAIKYMGDGIFLAFDDPIDACLAAVEIKKTAKESGTSTKGGIALGLVESFEIGGIEDLMGTIIDRCARLSSLAVPNQILIDSTMHDATESFLRDRQIIISNPIKRRVKGFGELTFFEISSKEYGFSRFTLPSLNVIEEGRMPLDEKMAFLVDAEVEIIEGKRDRL